MGIFQTGVSALLTYQQALNTTGHNIANVDTEGYSRQRLDLATQVPHLTGAGYIGSGVKIAAVRRQYDDFLATQVRSNQSAASEAESYFEHSSRIDNLLTDPKIGLDPAMQDFFDALQTWSDDPSSPAARQLVLSESASMVDRFHYLDRRFGDSRNELNKEMDQTAKEINSLAESLAQVNQNIISAIGVSGGANPNDLLDQREQLLNELAQRVNINTVMQEDGALNVFIGKGQALVMGSRAAKVATVPAQHDASERDLVFQNSSGTQVITDQIEGGSLGGLLAYRDQILNPAHDQLGLVAVGLMTDLNTQHQLGLDLDGRPGGPLFSSPAIPVLDNMSNTGTGRVTAEFGDIAGLKASGYELTAMDGANQYRLVRLSDGAVTTIDTGGASPYTTVEADGFTLTIEAGADAGDSFVIQPTRGASGSIDLLVQDPRELAAISPLTAQEGVDVNGNPVNAGNARITQPTVATTAGIPLAAALELEFSNNVDGAGNPGFTILNGPAPPNDYILYDPADPAQRAGKPFPDAGNPTQFDAFGGLAFNLSGTPVAGDRFTIGNNDGGVADNRNALILAGLQTRQGMLEGSGTYQDVYSQLVSGVGSKSRHAEVNYQAQDALLERNKAALSSVNGVNLDEEAANMVRYQQIYQASAQMINVANTLFDTLLAAVRR